MSECKNIFAILNELKEYTQKMNEDELKKVEELIVNAKRIFVAGAGRSGFAARGFANRLMHLGFTVFFVGEPTTPSIQLGDLLIIGSGSGNTASLVSNAERAKAQNAKVVTLTMFPENKIGSLADAYIKIPGESEKVKGKGTVSVQASGSSFEELSWITYDAMVMDLMKYTNQNSEDLFVRHANME